MRWSELACPVRTLVAVWSATCFLWVAGGGSMTGKTGTNLLTPGEIAQIRVTGSWPGDNRTQSTIVTQAERWMRYTPQAVRDMVPPAEVPRAFDVHFDPERVCPGAFATFGSYFWIIDPDKPYKLVCPTNGAVYPSNDFDPTLPGGPDDVSQEPYVDTGWGWQPPAGGQKYWFVAYYAHWLYHDYLVPATLQLAEAYVATGERKYARQAAALLDRIAEIYPALDYVSQSRFGTEIQAGRYHGRIVNRIWETSMVRTMARAYDYIFPALEGDARLEAAMGKRAAEIKRNIEENLLQEAARSIVTMDGRILGNFGMHHSALATIAIVLDNEQTEAYLDFVLHSTGKGGLWHYEGIVPGLTNFVYRDGAPAESAPLYNSLWTGHFNTVAELLLRRGINLYEEYPKLRRLFDYPLRILMAGRFTPNIGDSGHMGSSGTTGWSLRGYTTAFEQYGDRAYLIGRRSSQESDNMSAYGLAMLRTGRSPNETGIALYYGRAGGHGHWGRLNIEFFAQQHRMAPDLGYPEYATVYHKKRYGWTSHTLSHNTVLVDAQRQHTKAEGRLQAFASSPTVQYVDVRAEEAYPGVVDRYQRAVALVDVSDEHAYAVDVFRVSGGWRHDYSIHGPDAVFSAEGIELSPVQAEGTLAGEGVPFGHLYDAPRFEAPGYSGGYGSYAGSGFSYLRNVQRAQPNGVWRAAWATAASPRAHMQVTFVPEPGTGVIVADGEPPQNQPGNPESVKYVLVHNRAEAGEELESTFVTLLEAYPDQPYLGAVNRLPVDAGAGDGAERLVALEIEHSDGRDYVLQTPDTDRPHRWGGDAPGAFQGRFGLVSISPGGLLRHAYLLAGGSLRVGDIAIEAAGSYTGKIEDVDFGGRWITVRLDDGVAGLPAGDVPAHARIVISNEHHATEYTVQDVQRLRDGVYALTLGDTGFLTGQGETEWALAEGTGGSLGTRTPLIFGDYYIGQYLVNPATGAGGRIYSFEGEGGAIRYAGIDAGLQPGDPFHIYDFGPGDRFEIVGAVHVEAAGEGTYRVQTNVPATLDLGDGTAHTVALGEHLLRIDMIQIQAHRPRDGEAVQGRVPLDVEVTVPVGLDLVRFTVALGGETLYSGREAPAPGALVIDTAQLPEGEHTLVLTAEDDSGRTFRHTVAFDVANWWELIDELRAPVRSAFIDLDFTETSDASPGWAYATGQVDAFLGDDDRKVRAADTTEYLVWDTPSLREFALTVFVREPGAAAGVVPAVSADGEAWREVPYTTRTSEPSEAGWVRLELRGDLGEATEAHHFRLTVLDTVPAAGLQIGRAAFRGLEDGDR